eukprot:gene1530-1105_t
MATSLDDLISANQAELRKAKKDYDELFDKFKLASQLFEERDGVYRAKIGELEETVSQLKRKNDNLKFIINNQNATKEAFAEDVKQLQEVSQLLETREKSLTEACEILQRENRLQAIEINDLKSRLSQREDQYLRLEVLMQETMVPKTDWMAQQQRLQVMEDALHTDHVPKDVYERLAQECEALKAHMTSAMVEKATFEHLQHTHLELERRVPVDFVPIAEYAKLKRLLQEAVDERRLVAESAQVVQDQRDQQMTNYREIEAKAISLKGRVEQQEAEIRELRHEKDNQKMNGVFETSERQYQQRLQEVTEHNQRLQLQCQGTLQEIDLLHQENEHLRHHCRDVEALIADAKTQLTLQLASQETTLRDNELLRQQAQIWQAEKEQLFERLQRLQHDNQELHNYLEEFRANGHGRMAHAAAAAAGPAPAPGHALESHPSFVSELSMPALTSPPSQSQRPPVTAGIPSYHTQQPQHHGPASNGRSLAGRGASASASGSGSGTGSSALLRVSQTPVATSAAKPSAQTPPAPPVTSPTSYPAAPVSAPSPRSLLAQPRPSSSSSSSHPTPLAKAATTSDAVSPSGTLHAKTVMQNSARLLRKLIKAPSADNVVPRTASGRNLLHTGAAATAAAAAQSLHIDTDLNDLLHDVIDGVVADDEPADAPMRPATTATATATTPSGAVPIAAPSHGGINVTKPALNSPRSHAMAKSLSVTPSSTPGAVASFRPSTAAAAHVAATATATKPTSTTAAAAAAAAAATPSVFFPPDAPSPATATALDVTLDDAVDDSMRMHDHALVQSYRRGLH